MQTPPPPPLPTPSPSLSPKTHARLRRYEPLLRAMGIDPRAPITPAVVGEGDDAWGPHPADGPCFNTYCRRCYGADPWLGPAAENPRFAGREMIDLTNEELHILGR